MPVWNQRFSPTASGAAVGATIYTQTHLERILDYLGSIQKTREYRADPTNCASRDTAGDPRETRFLEARGV